MKKYDYQLHGIRFNVMVPDIKEACITFATAKEVWQSLEDRFSVEKGKVYDIFRTFTTGQRGDQSVQDHFSDLYRWYHRFVEIVPFPKTIEEHMANLEKMGVVQYLSELGGDFSQVCDGILGTGQLPALSETVSRVVHSASIQKITPTLPDIPTAAPADGRGRVEVSEGGGPFEVEAGLELDILL